MNKPRTAKSYFSRAEAEGKVGKRVRSLAGYTDILQGTEGTVVKAASMSWRKAYYRVAIQWDTPAGVVLFEDKVLAAIAGGYGGGRPPKPLVAWLSRDEYRRFLEEIEAPV